MAAVLPLTGTRAADRDSRPNIVVFIADDSGKDFGCYGNSVVQTPNIDRLRDSGLLVRNAFVTAPQSSPSRIAMMTGMFGHTLGVEDLGTPISEGTRMIPSYIRQNGYFTGAMLKTHWGEAGTGQFDFYFNGRNDIYSESYMTEDNRFFRKYRDFLDKAEGNPFFLWVGFIDPHRPYKEPHTEAVHNPDDVEVPPFCINAAGTREDYADYYDEIHRLDQHVGFMIEELERRSLVENTIIIFISDNGLPFIRGKAFLYDKGIEIPMIVSWPGHIKAGSEHSNGLVSTIDMAPTVLDICGVDIPEEMYGKSLLPLFLDPDIRWDSEIYAERNHHDNEDYIRCIRTDKYKLIYNAYPYKLPGISADMTKSQTWWDLMEAKYSGTLTEAQSGFFTFPRPSIELYDVEKDPLELNNLAYDGNYVDTVRELLSKLRKWQKETGDTEYWEKEKPDNVDRVTGMPLMVSRKK